MLHTRILKLPSSYRKQCSLTVRKSILQQITSEMNTLIQNLVFMKIIQRELHVILGDYSFQYRSITVHEL